MARDGQYHYTACGLDNVWLVNGFKRRATKYGEGISIQDARELHRFIAQNIVTGAGPIRGQEVRFLRSMLQVSQSHLGQIIGVRRSSVARWEAGAHDEVPKHAAHMLRLFYAAHSEGHKATKQVLEFLRAEDESEHGNGKIRLSWRDGWRRAA
jgi:DNA-binding transcriptional regulator YiaG